MRKADCQPHRAASGGTTSGASTAPMFDPALKMPVASAPLATREPLGRGLDRRREVPRLAQPQEEPRDPEPQDRAGQRVRRGRQRPDDERQGIADLRPHAIDQASHDDEADGVGDREREVDIAILRVGPLDRLPQLGLQHPEHAPIDVVDRRGEEEQGADAPADVTHLAGDRPGRRTHRAVGGGDRGADRAAAIQWFGHRKFVPCAEMTRTAPSNPGQRGALARAESDLFLGLDRRLYSAPILRESRSRDFRF